MHGYTNAAGNVYAVRTSDDLRRAINRTLTQRDHYREVLERIADGSWEHEQPPALSPQRYAMAALAVWPDDDASERVA